MLVETPQHTKVSLLESDFYPSFAEWLVDAAEEVNAAVALGGTSLFGGVASVFGTLVGVWIPAVLQNGFIIAGLQPYWQMIAVGFVLILAVWFDRVRRSRGGR